MFQNYTGRKLFSVQHGIPLLISGVDSHSTIRSMLEIESWYKQLTLSSTVEISNTHTAFCTSLAKTSIASTNPAPGSAPEMVLLKMPQKLKVESTDYNVTSLSEGFGDQISLCQPILKKQRPSC